MQPRLIATRSPANPDGVVLVMHGGASRPANPMVSPTQLSVLRMIPIANRIARRGRGRLAVFRLLNSARGWDTGHTPVDDARWALREIRDRYPGRLPTALVGHSLGARAALLASAEADVTTVVALAAWVYSSDSSDSSEAVAGAVDRRILFVHGSADRIASPQKASDVARALSKTCQVTFVCVEGGKHAMLRRHGRFDGLAADFVVGSLLEHQPSDSVDSILRPGAWTTV